MYERKYVFSQLTSLLNRNKFNYIVSKYKGDRYVKSFTCWNQLLVMMFGQLSNRASLRDLTTSVGVHWKKSYHLGFGKRITKSNLSKANESRDYKIYEEFAYYMIAEARSKRMSEIFKLDGNVYAFDSTTIDLCLSVFWWAKFRKTKGGIKVHTLYDIETQIPTFIHITTASVHDMNAMDEIPYEPGSYYIFDRGYNDFERLHTIHKTKSFFIIRAKSNMRIRNAKWKRRLIKNVKSDCIGYFSGYTSQKLFPKKIRKVIYWDQDQNREFKFLTNATHLTSLQVADLYKNRWIIELFFKWINQHLHIKTFYGTSMNAVFTQIWIAICDYLLLIIAKKRYTLEPSLHSISNSIGQILFKRGNIRDIFNQPAFSVNVPEGELVGQLNLW
ncbi:MAG: IS4 family transposase [Bacteroidales bacterium]|nr:IS4 family transposase [Bacteroidales bacterium]MDD4500413.1 IS4 family transposase [Bacteroidales bacterium]